MNHPLNIPPKIILLNINIVYTADKIIEDEANIPANDNLSNVDVSYKIHLKK